MAYIDAIAGRFGATVALVLTAPALVAGCSQERRSVMSQGRSNLHQIMVALGNYSVAHDGLPYSAKGSAYALYSLRDVVEASRFDATEGKKPEQRAFWDDQERCLRNGDFEYLNPPDRRADYNEVVVISRPVPGQTSAYLGTIGAGCWERDFPMPPDRRILGSLETVDQFLVQGKELFARLARTHVVAGHPWTTHSIAGAGPPSGEYRQELLSADVGGLHLEYRYAGRRLARCLIRTAKGTIEEDFETDELGQILGCRRHPENWKTLLP